jgi:hypothetical protein
MLSSTGSPVPLSKSRDTVSLMPDTKRLLELALNGLHAEREKITQEIADLEGQIRSLGGATLRAVLVAKRLSGGKRKGKKSNMTAAGRKALSDAAKRRWVASKKAGKSTL